MSEVDMSDAKAAFNSFFSTDTQKKPSSSPVKKTKEQGPLDVIHKVSGQDKQGVESISVNEADKIISNQKTFKEALETLDVKFSDLFVIIDSVLEKGYYEKSYTIKSFTFAFRTKPVHSVGRINDTLDGAKYTMASAAGHLLLEHSMASSLVFFKQGKMPPSVFSHETEEDDLKVLEFIRKLSTPIYSIMVNKLQRFELLTGLASRDEALDHFLAQTQD